MPKNMKVQIEILESAMGTGLYINGYRVAGPSPLGGGRIVKQWNVDAEEIRRAAGISDVSSEKKSE